MADKVPLTISATPLPPISQALLDASDKPCTHQPGTADPSCACLAAQAMKKAYDPVRVAGSRMAMAIRTRRRCQCSDGSSECADAMCRALAAWEAATR